ncbi:D-glycero-alpha-D-manno-heptose-1,7-bisphosphate 7-phosphatase [Marinifilum caeruleilacunae]|jgi:D-glycero-D-manno-heptose 1,7-bisphosphate phosphatase|uniref:D,D-heptose 1,7-bisphosphate phosphatase n=1 Tax=Marinifilum caeruleilacunae TaxID=2499076 RepID=A0ABX1WVV7_9BACT|nr:HAD family hydrolase [Marinifilum caeruleilacunae]NOU60236.1 HAD family hydrolase [Marinifilum caeruleilacunae]
MQKAIFLDRDGVINSDVGHYYIYRVEDFVINEGIIPSLKKFSEAGYMLFIVTNQGGVAKGIYTEDDVNKVHEHLLSILRKENITIEKIYFCPHHDSVAACQCRKPSPYFIKKAIKEYNIDPEKSFMIGDSPRDKQSAEAAGITGIKVDANENIEAYCDQILKGEL